MADYIPPELISTGTSYLSSLQQTTATAPKEQLDQTDFLRLLTTQLQNQDPSDPMDPTQFVTDLTQMSQLEATTQMNESLMLLTSSFQSMQTMQAASMIGKNVQVNGEDFSHLAGEYSMITMNLDQPLNDVKVVISDSNGLVNEVFMDDMDAGEEVIYWDGTDTEGNYRDSGVYSLTVYGTDEAGDLKMIDTIVASRVNAVSINPDSSVTLTLDTGEKINMEQVREISG